MRKGELVFNGQMSFPTMEVAAGTQVGDAVALTGPAQVGRGADGDPLVGKLLKLEGDGLGTVALLRSGFTDVNTVGTIATGLQNLVVDGAGRAKVGAAGPKLLVNIAQAGQANIQL